MAIPATQMRPGMIIKHNNELHTVFSVEHRTPGNLRAFIQAKLRNLRTGAMFEHRFRSPDPIDRVIVDEVPMDFLYADGDDYYFMNTENYEQTNLKGSTLGDAIEYLIPNLQIKVSFFDGVPVGIELPGTVEMTVVETEPGLKSATASSVTKPAKLETGLVVQVPPFINEGEKIRVDTAEGAYLSQSIEKGKERYGAPLHCQRPCAGGWVSLACPSGSRGSRIEGLGSQYRRGRGRDHGRGQRRKAGRTSRRAGTGLARKPRGCCTRERHGGSHGRRPGIVPD